MKAKITRPDGTILELEDAMAMDLIALGYGNAFPTITTPAFPTVAVCDHEYPNPWFGITPAPCKKCGQTAPSPYGVTYLAEHQ